MIKVRNRGINSRNDFIRQMFNQKTLVLMIVPALITLILFNLLPMFGIMIAFKNYKFGSVFDAPWVGLKHFITFFNGPYFIRLFRNTLLLGFYTLIFSFPATLALALLLNELKCSWFKRLTQTITYLPHFVSTVIVVGILKEFLSLEGLINSFVNILGYESINFLAEPKWFRTIFVASSLWQGIGWGTIMYLAALSAIDVQLYEAATIDGATRWQKVINVTLPALAPTISILLILNVGSILGVDSQKVLLMYNPLTYETADIFGTYTYREGIENGNYSYTTAVGLFTSVITMIFVCVTNYITKKISDTAMF